jgi:hypothetical protein
LPRFKNVKNFKNMQTVLKNSDEFVKLYHQQELERYKNPHKPWIFLNEEGSTSVVAPCCAKKPIDNQKPRFHGALESDRPGSVTLLTLSRDAASRLPDGVGTKQDMLYLIAQSQWIKDVTPNFSVIIGGAIDRLSQEEDPSVKYDAELKVYIYLHRNRKVNNLEWQDDQEPMNKMQTNCYPGGLNIQNYFDNSQHKEHDPPLKMAEFSMQQLVQ